MHLNKIKSLNFVLQTIECENIHEWLDLVINWAKRMFPGENVFPDYDHDESCLKSENECKYEYIDKVLARIYELEQMIQ